MLTNKKIMLKKTGLLSVVILLMVSMVVKAQAAVFTYPGSAPCNTILQACIDSTGVGDTVEIATNTPINESPVLNKSLVLKAAPGFSPVLAANHGIMASSGGTTNNSFTIQGITLQRGAINVHHYSTGTLTANILNNVIIESSITCTAAIVLVAGNTDPPVMGNMYFAIVNNQLTVPVDTFCGQTSGISILSGNNPAASGVIEGNSIVMQGCSQCAGIYLPNGYRTLTADVIGNEISGTNYDSGVSLYQDSPEGSITARVINNLITSQTGNVGAPAAIAIVGYGTMNVLVVNNTLTNNRDGVRITGRKDLGAIINGDVANNIIAYNSQSGLIIDSDFTSTVSNSSNLLYKNHFDMHSLGPGTLKANPRFFGTGDYRLQPNSRAINAGNNGKLPVAITTDIFGNPRMVGGTVDMGAFEFQDEVDLTGTWNSLTQTCRQRIGGEKCSLSGKLSVENMGDQDAPSSLVKFYLSGDGIYQPGVDTFLKQIATGVVKAGKSKALRISYSLPAGENALGKYVIAVIDAENTVVESNEANNIIVFGPAP